MTLTWEEEGTTVGAGGSRSRDAVGQGEKDVKV